MAQNRLDPDALLKIVQAAERQAGRGKLKIYLGAAPGVGKTYTMLEDAHDKLKQGLDVLVGVVESHGRTDIESLMQGLQILPKQKIEYKGIVLQEFDLDAALQLNPSLILMDEMAHTNAEGTRHNKRWQDIKELLDRGIDVYTTLNVQHIESLNDDVSGIIHAPIKETVPDSMLELADTIELVDLPPEDLLKRLHDGKVYYPTQAHIAKDKFFRIGNLIALRELALRVTAARVGAQVLLYRQGKGIKHIWSSNERILVCVGPGQESLKLIRSACRLATTLQAEWIAVFVDSAKSNLTAEQRNSAIKNLMLAEQLGAETKILDGYDFVSEIMGFAREENISLIMIWKHVRPRWYDFVFSQLADEIVRHSQEINVYIMTGSEAEIAKDKYKFSPAMRTTTNVYLASTGIIVVATLLNFVLNSFVSHRNLILVYLVAVTLVSLFGRIGPSILASILSVVAYGWFFFPSVLQLSVYNFEYLSTLILMILLTQVISHLTIITRRQAETARVAERQSTALHKLSRKLASARGAHQLLFIGAEYIADFFNSDVMVLSPEQQELSVVVKVGNRKTLDAKELSIAQWVYDLGQIAGFGTDTLPFSEALYVPLLASQGVIGVLRVTPKDRQYLITPDELHFLETCANQIALTVEVDRLQEQTQQLEMAQQIDNTRSALLQSVSQDLRAPLAAIMLAASTQMQTSTQLSPERVADLGFNIYQQSEQLSRLINNLLQITYLESNQIKLQKELGSLRDLVSKVLKASRDKLGKTPVYVDIPANLPLVPFDRVLLEEVIVNLLDNAMKFAPPNKAIEIFVVYAEQNIMLSVLDHGPGIAEDELIRVFDKFYKGRSLIAHHGLGLGLAVCKIIIDAHGGTIWAENNQPSGAVFKFTLPL